MYKKTITTPIVEKEPWLFQPKEHYDKIFMGNSNSAFDIYTIMIGGLL